MESGSGSQPSINANQSSSQPVSASAVASSGSASASEATTGSQTLRKRKNAPGSRTDVGWQHGYPVEGDTRKVKCKYCSKVYSGGIYRFKHHLACTKENVECCMSVPDDVKKQMLSIVVKIAQNAMAKRGLGSVQEDG